MDNGILLIDKEVGVSSREVDNLLKKKLDIRSIGHLGTLDPFASGLLVIGINDGTRIFPFLEEGKKTYEATLKLGESTDTGDNLGVVTEKKEVPCLSRNQIEEVLKSFLGKQKQVPPMYSAKHVEGKRAYELAREGIKAELKEQDIEIYSLSLGDFDGKKISFTCEVSKGTYIRVLGEDIAKRLGTLGHLISLRRTKVGDFEVKDSKKINDVSTNDIIHLVSSVKGSLTFFANKDLANKAINGRPLKLEGINNKFVFMCNEIGLPLAIYQKEGMMFVCKRGFGSKRTKVINTDKDGIKGDLPSKPIALAIGEFDGIHKGHQKVLEELKKSKLDKYVMVFSKDFKTRIRNLSLSYLMDDEEKISDFLGLGFLDGIIFVSYEPSIVSLSPLEFIERILKPLKVKEIFVGKDFSFGYLGKGKCDDLVKEGFKVKPLEFVSEGERKISTTGIKSLLKEGKISEVNSLLGHYYSFKGKVVHGFEEGRKLGFPTANMIPPEGQIIPGNGVYKTYSLIDSKIYHSMTNVGIHPTINKLSLPIIETTVLDGFKDDLYDKEIKIIFEKKLRNEVKFLSLDELISQLRKDEDDSKEGSIDFKIGDYPFL